MHDSVEPAMHGDITSKNPPSKKFQNIPVRMASGQVGSSSAVNL